VKLSEEVSLRRSDVDCRSDSLAVISYRDINAFACVNAAYSHSPRLTVLLLLVCFCSLFLLLTLFCSSIWLPVDIWNCTCPGSLYPRTRWFCSCRVRCFPDTKLIKTFPYFSQSNMSLSNQIDKTFDWGMEEYVCR
jgi:hypothetical protein